LAVALGFGLLSLGAQSIQWRSLLTALGLRRGWWRCVRGVLVGSAFNAVLPSAIGGDVVRAIIIADSPSERITGASTVVLQRLSNFPGMVLLMTLGVVFTVGDPAAARLRPVAVVGAVMGAAVVAVCMSPLLGLLAGRPFLARHLVGRVASGILRALDAFRGRRRALTGAWLRGTLFWVLGVLNQWAFMHAVGIDASLPLAAVATTTVAALTMLPLSINGFGVREGSFAVLLSVAGLATASQGAAVGLLVSGQSLLWALAGLIWWWVPQPAPRPTSSEALGVA
jgi:uncharacterized protein (TIRG00374 family)